MTTPQRLTTAALVVITALMAAAVLVSMAMAGEFDHIDGRFVIRVGGAWR